MSSDITFESADFITANKGIKKFHLESLEAKTFTTKKGDVTYIPVEISW